MNLRSKRCLTVALSTLPMAFAAASASAVDLVGVHSAHFRWSGASGQVQGYTVYVATNGGDFVANSFVDGADATVDGIAYGDQVQVAVQAMGPQNGGDYVLGPLSVASDPVRFMAPPQLNGTGTVVLRCSACGTLEFRSVGQGEVVGEAEGLPGAFTLAGSADVDGDGNADLLWLDPAQGALVVELLDQLAPVGSASAVSPQLKGMRIAGAGSFDGSGSQQIVVAPSGAGPASIWAVDGSSVQPVASISGPAGSALAGVADFDGDGHSDLVWLRTAAAATTAPATLTPLQRLLQLYAPLLQLWFGASLGGNVPWWLAPALQPGTPAGDSVTVPTPQLEVALTTGFQVSNEVEVGPSVPAEWSLAGTGDYDGDGTADLLWRDSRDGALIVWYLADGAFVRQSELPVQNGDVQLQVVASHDFIAGHGDEIVLQDPSKGRITLIQPDGSARVVFSDPGSQWQVASVSAD